MCAPASMVVTRDHVYWSKTSEHHQDIICEHRLVEDVAGRPTLVRVEISPADGDWRLPVEQWAMRVDQDVVPEWWDAAEGERRVRAALPKWIAAKLVLPGQVRDTVRNGDVVIASYGEIREVHAGTVREVRGGTVDVVHGGTVREVYGGTVGEVCGGTVGVVCGGTVRVVYGGTVGEVCGGTVGEVHDGTVGEVRDGGTVGEVCGGVVRYRCHGRCTLVGPHAVVIDDAGETAVCHVGTKTPRVVTTGDVLCAKN